MPVGMGKGSRTMIAWLQAKVIAISKSCELKDIALTLMIKLSLDKSLSGQI